MRNIYKRLLDDGFAPWLDEENLLPGQDWNQEIVKAVRNSDVVLICLSNGSVTKTGFVQKEIKYTLDIAAEQSEGTIFLIPLRLEECDMPERLKRWHWVNLFEESGYERLLKALHLRTSMLRKAPPKPTVLRGKYATETLSRKWKDRVVERGLETYYAVSPIASWLLGGTFIGLLVTVSFLPNPTQFQKDAIRFFVAITAAFFTFFLGGVLLKRTLKDLSVSAIGSFVLFILIQFVLNPFNVISINKPQSTTASVVTLNSNLSSPTPTSATTQSPVTTTLERPSIPKAANSAQANQTVDQSSTPKPTPIPSPTIRSEPTVTPLSNPSPKEESKKYNPFPDILTDKDASYMCWSIHMSGNAESQKRAYKCGEAYLRLSPVSEVLNRLRVEGWINEYERRMKEKQGPPNN